MRARGPTNKYRRTYHRILEASFNPRLPRRHGPPAYSNPTRHIANFHGSLQFVSAIYHTGASRVSGRPGSGMSGMALSGANRIIHAMAKFAHDEGPINRMQSEAERTRRGTRLHCIDPSSTVTTHIPDSCRR